MTSCFQKLRRLSVPGAYGPTSAKLQPQTHQASQMLNVSMRAYELSDDIRVRSGKTASGKAL